MCYLPPETFFKNVLSPVDSLGERSIPENKKIVVSLMLNHKVITVPLSLMFYLCVYLPLLRSCFD